jgi:hypothetical protein
MRAKSQARATKQVKRKRAPAKKSPHLYEVPKPAETFKTQDELDAALRRSIIQTAKFSAKGVFETPGICHGSKSDKALQFNPASGEVHCIEGCEYKTILRAFKLPEQPEADKADALSILREELGVPFKRIIKLGKTNSNFDVELDDGLNFSLGSAGDVLRVSKVEEAIADATGRVIPSFTKAKWRPFAQRIFDVAEVVHTFSEADETRSWIEAFISSSQIRGESQATMTEGVRRVALDDKAELFKTLRSLQRLAHKPHSGSTKGFIGSDERVYLYIETFMYFINFNGLCAHRLSLPVLAERLTRLSFKSHQLAARQGDDVVKVRLWCSPAGFIKSK